MSIVFLIDSCEAIPVRAIPYVTGWSMSPDAVVSWLAHTEAEGFQRIPNSAHHLLADGKFAPMLPKEWDGIEADLKTLSTRLHATETFEKESYPAWRRESVPLLPAGVFVWKDEFEKAFSDGNSRYNRFIPNERLGDRDLNFSPLIPQGLLQSVVEGFTGNAKPADQAMDNPNDGNYRPLMVALAGYWETLFDQLPDAVKPFALELKPMGWNDFSPQQRQSVATQLDWQRDPRCEPSLYWELTAYQSELGQQESIARNQANHGVALVLVDVQKQVDKILNIDRARVGCEIQRLRDRQAEVDAEKLVVMTSPAEIDPTDLPTELDAANVAFRAMLNGYGDQSKKPRIRLVDYLKKHHPELSEEAVDRIATVANPVKTPGGMKRNKE